jgi:L-2-hydroxyglutarate oxidase LhgO
VSASVFGVIRADSLVDRKNFQKILQKQGFKFKLNTKVTSLKREGDTVTLEVEGAKDGKKETVSYPTSWRATWY